jgi:hypothetical protein
MSRKFTAVSGVTLEWDDARHPALRAKDGPRDKSRIPRSEKNDDEFIPSRIVIDLKLDLGDDKAATVDLDDVHLKIPYKGEQPTVGWWTGARWVKFKQITFANNVADITLPSPWPTDPAIGLHP